MYKDSSHIRLVTVRKDGSAEILFRDQTFMDIPKERVEVKEEDSSVCAIEFTKEEREGLLIQIGARLDDLKQKQDEAREKGNLNRVMELEASTKPIRSGYDKILQSSFS